jgi:hypothetical protein
MLLVGCQAWSQSSIERDSVGWVLFGRANWQGIKQNSQDALDLGFHTHGFIWRLAVAEFELGHWQQAERRFRQAMSLNPLDTISPRLLALLLFKMGRTEEAGIYQRRGIQLAVGIDAGLKMANNDSLGVLNYQSAHIQHHVFRSASLSHAFTRLQQQLYWGDFTQQQYYVAYKQAFRGGWLMTLGAHILQFSGNILFDSTQFDNGGEVYALELRKTFGYFSLVPQYSLSTLYGRMQQQWGIRLSVHPGKFAAWRYDINPMANRDSVQRAIAVSQAIHWFPSARLHFSVNHYTGNGYNFQEQAGFLVNNGINLTRHRLAFYAEYRIFTHWRAFVLLQQEAGTERFFNFDYRYRGLFTGIKFQP